MDVFPKFIIETDNELGDCLIISRCTYHNELIFNEDNVKGGGWWDLKDNMFILYGESGEFGKAQLEDIEKCIKLGNVFLNPYLDFSIIDEYDFGYNTGSEIINLTKFKK